MPHNLVIETGCQRGGRLRSSWENRVCQYPSTTSHRPSKLIDFGKTEVIEFTAPKQGGNYEFVCIPGHHILMRGVMKVK